MKNLADLIEKSIALYARNYAMVINNEKFTYAELGERVTLIYRTLKSLDLKTNEIIAVMANDDIETYATVFAIWKARCVFLPIHPHHPKERNLDIIHDSGSRLLIASDGAVKGIPEGKFCILDSRNLVLKGEYTFEERTGDAFEDLAYILYTSGSTGKPKGVKISHKNFIAFIESMEALPFAIQQGDRCLQCFDITFDVGIQAFILPLLKGACVYTVPHNVIKYSYVCELIENNQLTFVTMAPSMIKFLEPYFSQVCLDTVRICVLTAEASRLTLIKEWSKVIPKAQIYNLYGPTECTVYCTCYHVEDVDHALESNGLIAIGRAFKNVGCKITNDKDEFIENEWGELCLSGAQLTTGYYNKPQLNELKFFIGRDGIRYYRTGDRCKWENDILLYGGRFDNQVKIQGYRVELGEIEHRVQGLTNIETIAVCVEDATGVARIGIFQTFSELNEKSILEICRKQLPSYMHPSYILQVIEFPLNVNQKVDRVKLKSILMERYGLS